MKYSLGLIRSAPKKPPIFLRFRSSEVLIISTVALAIFTDIFLYGVSPTFLLHDFVPLTNEEIIPILPFALEERVGVEHSSVQSSVSILLAVYAAGLIAASPIVGWTAGIHSFQKGLSNG
jgi:MFS family permease